MAVLFKSPSFTAFH